MPHVPDLTLYLGGTRSGKSALAEAHARALPGPVFYVATCRPDPADPDMAARIRRHRERRPAHWHTLECPRDPARLLAARLPPPDAAPAPVVLLDCVTLWLANILCSLGESATLAAFESAVETEVRALVDLMGRTRAHWIVVSGEVGLGGIGTDAASRLFADGLGLANQLLAGAAREAWLVVAGRRLKLEA
ncbi:MAG: bifunctional adenosylcobinamide kinase/adenosylcobinamide-phosphate guanylyltransferase [Ottowia sp.]|nr:bifunctional adenosylcobinamide kinase/adenosylcobinamide-phosphate guanylyltransferase [Ottowia sp.]